MPVSSTSIATMNSRTRMLRMPIACGDSSVDRHEERRQQHQPQRDAVDAQVEPDAERRDPDLVDLSWKPAWAESKSRQDQQRRRRTSPAP